MTFLRHIKNLNKTTFPEFVDIILEKCGMNDLFCNEHWEPQYVHCNYCDVKYDFIGRVESLENDIRFIAHSINMTSNLTKFNLHLHPSGMKESETSVNNLTNLKGATAKIDKTKRYFEMLNPSQIKKLYIMYQNDFEMFGYSTEPYHSVNILEI